MSKPSTTPHKKNPLSVLIECVASPVLPRTGLTLASLLAIPAWAVDNNITPDAGFTTMATDGTGLIHTITANNAAATTVNVFNDFVVGTGHTVNLEVPKVNGQDAVLVNIVRDSRPEVWGTLNSVLENSDIGGSVFFASSNGFLVGSTGVMNVGNLTVRTPTSDEMDKLISGGASVSSEVTRLVNGEMSINDSATISIQGKVVTGSGLTLDGGKIEVADGGILMAGKGYQAVFQSAVNTGDYTAPTELEVDGGTITLKAKNGGSDANPGIAIDGDLIADGGITIGISTSADPDISFDVNETAYISLGATSQLDTRDKSDAGALTNAGNIIITAKTEADVNFALAETASKVSLDGKIQAGELQVKANSDANAEARDAGSITTKTLVSTLAGIDFSYLETDASSIIEIGSGADIDTQGDINFNADANSVARSNDFVLSSQTWALGTNYSRTDATAHVVVQSGAKVKTQGDLNLRADNEAYIESAVKNYILDDDADYALSVIVGNANVDALAQIDSGVTLDADNLSVVATNQNFFQLKAAISDYSEKGARGGFSIAIGDFDTNARAILGASIGTEADPVGNIQVISVNRTHRQQVAASVSVGASGLGQLAAQAARTAGSAIGSAAANQLQTDISDKSKSNSNSDTANNSKTDDSEENKVNWKAGSAFALNLGDNDSYAFVGNTETNGTAPTIYSTGDLYVLTANDTYSWRTSAESSISAPKCQEGDSGGSGNNTSCSEKSYSFAINVAVENLDTRAEIGENSVIHAANVAVDASQRLPITQSYTEWQNLESITSQIYAIIGTIDGKGGMVDNLLTNFANSSASAEELAIGGTVNSTIGSINTSAWISDGASITATGTGAAGTSITLDVDAKLEGILSDSTSNPVIAQQYNWNSSVDDSRRPDFYETDGSKSSDTTSPFLNTENRNLPADAVVVKATNIVEDLSLIGNMGTLLIGPAGGTNQEGKSLGGAVSVDYMDVKTLAGVGDAKITASSGNLGVYSDFKERHIVITPTSGSGKGFGFNGILNILITDAVNHASVSKDAEITVDGLEVSARHDVNSWSAAGAVVASTPTAIGMALTGNFNTTDNKAYIGDNTGDRDELGMPSGGSAPVPTPAPSTPAPVTTTAGITTRNVKVKSTTNGMVGAVAAAGAYTSGAPRGESSGGYAQQAKSYLKDTSLVKSLAKFMPALATGTGSVSDSSSSGSTGNSSSGSDSVASGDTDSSGNPTNTDSTSTENQNKVNTGWTGAGSFSLALSDIDSRAIIDGAIIKAPTSNEVAVDVQGLSKITGVSASGAAGLTWCSGKDAAPDNTNNMAGAIAYQFSANDTRANIFNSTITSAGDVAVNAVHGGDRVSIGLGLSVTIDAQKNEGETRNAGISFSGAAVEDTVQATVEDSNISSSGWDNDIEVTAYNTTNVGVGGGAFYFGSTQGLGLAITVATIGNNTDSIAGQLNDSDEEEVLAGVYNSTLTDFQNVDISSRDLSRIAIAAAGGGYGTQAGDDTKDTKGFAGSFAISDIGIRSRAVFDNSTIATSNSSSGTTASFEINAIGSRNGTLDTLLSDLGDSGVSADYDFSGEKDVLSSNSVYSDDSGDGAAINANSEGARIISVSGVFQGGSKQNVGISYINSDIHNTHEALISGGSTVTAGNVEVAARDEALIYNIAIGVGVSTGDLAGVGSVSVAEVNNRTHAEIGDWDSSSRSGAIHATNLAVQANNEADIFNLAGAVAFAKGDDVSSKAGGLAATVTLIGNQQGHETHALVSNTSLDVSGNISVKALSGTSDDDNDLISNAIGVGITSSGEGIAFAGAITTSNVDQDVHAGVKNIGTSGSMNMSSSDNAGDLTVLARDDTFAVGTAWTIAASSEGSSLGVSVTTNRVDSDVTAEVLGDGSTADSSYLKMSDAVIKAERDNHLLSIDAGVAIGDKLSGAGSVSTNVVDGDVTARIADKARIDSYNNLGVVAYANTFSEAGSGALGVGLNGGAGAVALSTALEYGDTKAYVENSTVNAAGRSGTMTAITGELSNDPSRPEFGEDGSNENDKQAKDVDLDATLDGFDIASLDQKTENVTGLLVQSSSLTKQRAIDIAGSYGSSYAAAINVATNATWGDTQSYISGSSINTGISPTTYTKADVNLRAAHHALELAISGGGAFGGTGGGVAGFATNHYSKDVEANITSSTVNADDLNVIARQTNLSQAVAAGIGGGGSYGGAASVVITVMKGSTKSHITGSTVTAGDVAVNAESIEDSAMASGSAGIGGTAGVGVTLAINELDNNTESYIGKAPGSRDRTTDTTINADTLTVDANRQLRVENWSFGVGGGGTVGAAVMLAITSTNGHTLAGIYGKEDDTTTDVYTTKVRAKDGSSKATSVDVNAQETTSTFTGALGIGGGGTVGVGAVANVVLQKSQVISEVVGSYVHAIDLDVDAYSARSTDLYNLSFGGGTGAVAASIGVVMTGKGDGGDASSTFSSDYQSMAEGATDGDSSYDNVLSETEKTEILSKRSADFTLDDLASAAPTDPANHSGYSKDGSTAELAAGHSATLANISGGQIDVTNLSVIAQALHHDFSVIGAAQGSAVGVSAGIGVTRINEQVQAVVDTDLDATNATVRAHMDDVSDDDASGEMLSIVAGAGGTAIGVAVNDMRSSNRVLAALSQGTGTGAGTLDVSAEDGSELRIGDIDSSFDSDEANDRINDIGTVNAQFGVAAVGVSYNYAEKSSDVDSWLGADGGTISGFSNIYVDAYSQGVVKSIAYGAAGGLFIGTQAVVAEAEDSSSAKSVVAGDIWTSGVWDAATSTASGAVQISAQTTPETIARAYGITVSGLGAVGGSFAYATADTTANVEVDSDSNFYFAANSGSGTSDLNAVPVTLTAINGDPTDEDYESALALSFAASGGLLLGLTGSNAEADNTGTTRVSIEDNVNLPYNNLSATALGVYHQRAESDGYFAGALAGGASIAGAYSATTTDVLLGKDPMGSTRAGDISLSALSDTSDMAFSIAGGGGVLSGSAAEAHAGGREKSNGSGDDKYKDSVTQVVIDDWTSGQQSVDVGSLSLQAQSSTKFFAGTDSTTGSVVGGSGASGDSGFSDKATVDIGNNVKFHADRIAIEAAAFINQYDPDNAASIAHFNSRYKASVQAGSGGVLNGSTSHSLIKVEDLDATVNIGNKAELLVNIDDNTVYSTNLGNNILINAYSGFGIDDQATLVVGGAFQGAGAESIVTVNTQNAISIGTNAKIQNDIGKLGLGSWSQGGANSDASVSLYAAAGLAGADSEATINSDNTISVGNNTKLQSTGLLNILAGRSGDYLTENSLSAEALGNIYLGALIPISGTKTAKSTITANNTINLGSADIFSVRDIFIEADKGAVDASDRGVVKNLYDTIGLSSEDTFGSSNEYGTAVINFTGATHVEAGIYHEQTVEITSNGNVYVNGSSTPISFSGEEGQVPDSFSGMIFKPTEKYSARDEMQSYLDSLNSERTALIASLMSGQTAADSANSAVGDDAGDTVSDTSGSGGTSTGSGSTGLSQSEAENTAEVLAIDGEISFISSVLSSLPSTSNNQIIVTGVTAAGGDVNMTADSYSVSGSSPQIIANGDPLIKISNKSNNTLVLGDLTIPISSGGDIVLQGGLSVTDLATKYGTSNTSTSGSLIDVDHEPIGGTNNGDVAISGTISNLGGTVDINAVTGSVIQTATVEARELSITVNSGTYLLNNPYSYQSFGFDPKSLVGYTTRFKPQNADDFVDYYVSSANYSTWTNGTWDSAVDDGNDNSPSFNEWFYGDVYDDDIDQNYSYNQGGTAYGGTGTYAGRLNINVYKNWGFRDVEGGSDWYECSSNCVQFSMGSKDHGGDRGGGDGWKFTPIDDKRNSLTSTASYAQVQAAGYAKTSGNAISAQTVAINAYQVDINGTIHAGNYNNWSVQVGSGFDAAVAQYINAKGLKDGDKIVLTPGSSLSYQTLNPSYTSLLPSWYPGNERYITTTLDPQVSLVNRSNSDAGISLVYDVASKHLQVNDVEASGNGFVTIRGRIMSTGQDGKIQVDNGLGDIKVVNNSSTALELGNIDAGQTSAGVVRITDLNSSKKVNGKTVSQWYVNTPGGDIETYVTLDSASTYTGSTLSSGSVSGSSATYNPEVGQVYWFKEEKQITRTATFGSNAADEYNGWVATYGGVGSGDTYGWVFDNQNTSWDLVGSGVTSCASAGLSCNASGSANNYLTHIISADTSELRTRSISWFATYKDYYGGEFTNNDYVIRVATQLGLDAYTYVKADNAIGIDFVGAAAGKVDVQSVGDLLLTGSISNADGSTTLKSTGGSITGDSSALTTSTNTTLYAKNSLGTSSQALVVQTDRLNAQSANSLVNLDLSAVNSNSISLDKIWAADDLAVVSSAGLLNQGSNSTQLKGDNIDLTITQGGLGGVDINSSTGAVTLTNLISMDSNGTVTISSGEDEDGNLQAVQGNIALKEVSGDLAVNQILANGDVYIDVASGSLVNVNSRNTSSAEEQAYEEDIWSVLGLNDDTFEVGQAQVDAYNTAVTGDYHRYFQLQDQIDRVTGVYDGSYASAQAVAEASDDTANAQRYNLLQTRVATDFAQILAQQTDLGLYAGYDLGTEAAPNYSEYLRLLSDQQQTLSDRLNGIAATGEPHGVGIDLNASYNKSFAFDLQTADATLYTQLLEGARWEDNQLEVSINRKAFENTDSGSVSNSDRVSSIAGVDVYLKTSSNLGTNDSEMAFTITKANPNLDGTQKSALLNASAGDVRATLNQDSDGNFLSLDLNIDQVNTIKIDATGYQQLQGGGLVYVESELDQKLHRVSGGSNVRLETEGAITQSGVNATTITAGGTLNLAANNGIGSNSSYLTFNATGALKNASSSGDVYLYSKGDLILGNLNGGSTVRLDVDGNLSNWDQGLAANVDGALLTGHIGGEDVALRVDGSAGASSRYLVLKGSVQNFSFQSWDFTTNKAKTGTADKAYIDSRGSWLTLGDSKVAGSLSFLSDGILNTQGDIYANSNLYVSAAGTAAEAGSSWGAAQSITINTSGDMTLGGLLAGVGIQLTSNAGIDFSDFAISGTSGITANALGTLTLDAGVDLTSNNNSILLYADKIDGAASSTVSAKLFQAQTSGDMTLGSLSVQNLVDLDAGGNFKLLGNATSTSSQILINAAGDLDAQGKLQSYSNSSLESLNGDINLGAKVTVQNGDLALTATNGSITLASAKTITASGDVNSSANAIDFASNSTVSANTLDLDATTDLSLGKLIIANAATLNAGNDLSVLNNMSAASADVTAGNDLLLSKVDITNLLKAMAGNDLTVAGDLTSGSLDLNAGHDLLLNKVSNSGAATLVTTNALTVDGDLSSDSLSYTSGGAAKFNGLVTITNGLTGISTGASDFAAAVNVGDLLDLTSGAGISFASSLNGKTILLGAQDSIVFNGAVSVTDGMTANSTAGDIAFNAATDIQSGNLQLTATDGDIALNDDIAVDNGDFILSAANGTITLAIAKSITASGEVKAVANAIDFAGDSTLTANTIDLDVTTDLSLGKLIIADSALLNAGDDLSVLNDMSAASAEVTAGNDLLLSKVDITNLLKAMSGNDLTVVGNLTSGSLDLNAGHDLLLNKVSNSGAATLVTTNALTVDGDLSSDSLSYTSGGAAKFNGLVTITNGLTGNSTGASDFAAAVNVGDLLDLTSGAGISFASSLNGKTILLGAQDSIVFNGVVSVIDGMTANSTAGDIEFNAATDIQSGNLQLTATDGDIALSDDIVVDSGDFILSAANGSINLASAKSITASGEVNASANAIDFANDSTVSANTLDLDATTDLSLGKLIIADAATLNAGNDLSVLNDISAASAQVTAGNDLLLSEVDITNLLKALAGNDLIVAGDLTSGSLDLNASHDLLLNKVSNSGAASFVTTNALTVDGDLSSDSLNYTSDGAAKFNGLVTITNNLTGNSTGASDFVAAVNVGDLLELTSGAGISFASSLNGKTILLGAQDSIAFNGAVSVIDGMTAESTAGDIEFNAAADIQSSDLQLIAIDGGIALNDDVFVDNGDFILSAANGTITLASAKTITASGEVNVVANAIDFASDSTVTANTLDLDATTDLSLGKLIIADAATLNAGNDLSVLNDISAASAQVTAGNDLLLSKVDVTNLLKAMAGNDLTVVGVLTSGNLDLSADKDLLLSKVDVANLLKAVAGNDTTVAGELTSGSLDLNAGHDLLLNKVSNSGAATLVTTNALTVDGDLSTDSLSYTSGGAAKFNGLVTITNGLTGNSTGASDFAAAVNVGDLLDINSGAGISFASSLNGKTILLGAQDSIAFNGAVSVINGMTANSTAGDIAFNAAMDIQSGDLQLTATDGDIALYDDASVDNGDFILSAANGTITLASAKTITASDEVNAAANAIDFASDSTVSADSLDLDATTDLSLGKLIIADAATLNAGNDLSVLNDMNAASAQVTAGNDLLLSKVDITNLLKAMVGNDLTVAGNLTSGNLELSADKDLLLSKVDVANLLKVVAGNDLIVADDLTSGSLDLNAGHDLLLNKVSNSGAASFVTTNALTVDGDLSSDSLSYTSGGAAKFNGLVTITNGLTGNSTGASDFAAAVNVGDLLDLTSGAGISFASSLNGKTILLGAQDSIVFNGAVSVINGMTANSTAGDIALNAATEIQSGDLQLTASDGDIALNDDVSVDNGDFILSAAKGTITLASAKSITASGEVNAAANAIDFASDSIVTANTLDLDATTDLSLGKLIIADAVTLNAGNDLSVLNDMSAASAEVMAGNDLLLSKVVITNLLKATAGNDLIVSGDISAGDMQLSAGNNLGLLQNINSAQMDISVAQDLLLGNVNVAGAFKAQTGHNLTVAGDMNTGSLNLAVGNELLAHQVKNQGAAVFAVDTNLTLDGDFTSGSLDFVAGEAAQFNAAVTVSNNLTGKSGAATQFASALNVDSVLDITSDTSLSFFGQVQAASAIVAVQNDVLINSGFNALSNVALFSSTGNININGDFLVGGDLSLQAKLARISVAEAIRLHAQGSAVIDTAELFAADAADIETLGDLQIAAQTLSLGDNSSLNVGHNAQIDTDVFNAAVTNLIQAGGNLQLTSTGHMNLGVIVDTTQASLMSVDVGGDLLVQGSLDAYDLNLASAGYTEFKQVVNLSNSMSAQIGGDFVFDADVRLDNSASIESAGTGLFNGKLTAAQGIQVNSLGDLQAKAMVLGFDIGISSAQGSITLDADVQANGRLTLMADGALILNGNTSAITNAELQGESLTMAVATVLSAESVSVVTRGDQLINQIFASTSSGSAINLIAGGAVLGRADLDYALGASHLNVEGDTGLTRISAGTGIGNPMVVDLGLIAADTATGEINLISRRDLHAQLLDVKDGGDLVVTALQDLNVDQLHGTSYLYSDGDMEIVQADISAGDIRARNLLTIDNLQLTSAGPLGLHASSITANILGQDENGVNLPAANLVVEGFEQFTRTENLDLNLEGVDQLNVSQLAVEQGSLTSDGSGIYVDQLDVETSLLLQTNSVLASINNETARANRDYDVQMQTFKDQPFWLVLDEDQLKTSALVTRRDPKAVTVESYPGKDINRLDGEVPATPIEDSQMQQVASVIKVEAPTPQLWYSQLQSNLNWMSQASVGGLWISLDGLDAGAVTLDSSVQFNIDAEDDKSGETEVAI